MKILLRIFLSVALFSSAFADITARNGISVTPTSSVNGITPVTAINGLTVGYDSDAQNYFNLIVANGSSINDTAKNAINNFVIGCKADGIWALLLDVGPLCGDDLAGAVVKLKKLSPTWAYGINAFVNGDYSQATGLTGNGTNKFLMVGITASTDLTAGNTGIAVYNRTTSASTQNIHGVVNNAGIVLVFYTPWSDDKLYSSQYSEPTDQISSSAITGAPGLVHGVRTSAPLHSIFRNGVSVASSSSVSGAIPADDFYFFARRNIALGPGGADFFSNNTYSFLAITEGMDSTQAAAFYARVQALQTALGRQVMVEPRLPKPHPSIIPFLSDLPLAA